MFEELSKAITLNKNLLMFVSVGFYILGLFATLSNNLLLISLLITIFSLWFLIKEKLSIKVILAWVLMFYFGVLNTSLRLKQTDVLLNMAPVNSEIKGTIVSIPQGWSEGKPKFYFDVNEIKFGSIDEKFKNEKLLVTLNFDKEKTFKESDFKIYDSYILKGRLSVPFKAGNPSQFDYGNYLRNYGTYAVFYAKDYEHLKSEKTIKQKTLQKINDSREYIINVHSEFLKSPNLEILGGIVFGDDAISPSKEIKQSFINSGLLHILAASGMNVAFIYGFFYQILAFLRVNYRTNLLLSILMVVIYTLMTGMGASVIRAAFMLIFVLVGKLIDRDAHSIALLSFVALLMLIYNPMYINDVGFQLSFIVTFGILVTAPAVVKFNNKIKDFIVGNITIPIIAQLWVIPIQIFYFNNISIYSVFANIMSVPLLMVISLELFLIEKSMITMAMLWLTESPKMMCGSAKGLEFL